MKMFLIIGLILNFTGCKKLIQEHELSFESDQVISKTTISENYGLPFSGNFPLVINEQEYGEVNLYPKTDSDDFSVEIIADFSAFTGDVWDGFDPISKLPGNNSFPTWVSAENLLRINIPTLSDNVGVDLIFGKSDGYYFGITIGIKQINEKYPEGLKASQEIAKKSSKVPWAEIFIHGPQYDSEGNLSEDAGITILSSFAKNKVQ
jgi:hypothetical protein